jgi:hypothetical protein
MNNNAFVPYDTKPTQEYDRFQQAYDYFNARLFNSELTDCLITLQRAHRAGTFGPASLRHEQTTPQPMK